MTDPRALVSRAGLSQSGAARFLGRDVRTVQRWCSPPGAPITPGASAPPQRRTNDDQDIHRHDFRHQLEPQPGC